MTTAIDWQAIFIPSGNPLELVVRGTLMYFAILAAFRVLRREAGSMAIADLLVVVLVADAAQNAMAAEYKSVTEGLVLVGTIFAWDYLLDWAAYHSPVIRRVVQAPPLVLVKDGHLQRRNLRQELISVDELRALLREHGVEDLSKVKRCCLESDGQVSVIQDGETESDSPNRKRGLT
jgi:uncharacterized membrane protein YcaP (DUF421 family)